MNPGVDHDEIDYVLDTIDQVLVMTVNPGFGGQSFISSQLEKIKAIRQKITNSGRNIDLAVDGGINRDTATQVIDAGANVLVAGTAVFSGGPEKYKNNISGLIN